MKTYFLMACMVITMPLTILAQKPSDASHQKSAKKTKAIPDLPDYETYLQLEPKLDTTANVSMADFDGDHHLDILLVKGRHWPILDKILLGDGTGKIRKTYNLGQRPDRSYTGAVADFNKDGFPDVAVSNDSPDKKVVYLNDGKGNFKLSSEFGLPDWPTRNLATADINKDGFPDLILANRGDLGQTSNAICLNNGKGQFTADCISFAPYPTTTISPADFNKDGFVDLVAPHRDGGQSYVYLGGADKGFSDARRIPFGPDSATIRIAAVGDFDGDHLLDIVTSDEYKGVYLYFGQKEQTFSAGIMLADAKVKPYTLAVIDLNKDGRMDIVVGHIKAPSTIFFNDGTGRNFKPVSFGDSQGTVYGFAFGDFNENGVLDIAAARSDAPNMLYFGNTKPKARQ